MTDAGYDLLYMINSIMDLIVKLGVMIFIVHYIKKGE